MNQDIHERMMKAVALTANDAQQLALALAASTLGYSRIESACRNGTAGIYLIEQIAADARAEIEAFLCKRVIDNNEDFLKLTRPAGTDSNG